jgi:hypothetical protein
MNEIEDPFKIEKTILLLCVIVIVLMLFDHPGRPIFIALFGIYGIIIIIIEGVIAEVLTIVAVLAGISFIPIAIMTVIEKIAEMKNTHRVEEE